MKRSIKFLIKKRFSSFAYLQLTGRAMIIGVHQHQTGQRGKALEEEAPDRGRSGEHQRLDAGGDVRVEAQVVH